MLTATQALEKSKQAALLEVYIGIENSCAQGRTSMTTTIPHHKIFVVKALEANGFTVREENRVFYLDWDNPHRAY